MNRFTAGIPSVLAASLLTSAVWAADAAPAMTRGEAASAARNAPARAAPAVARSIPGGAETGVRKLVCLNMSLQCFSVTPPPADGTSKMAHTRPLDLRAPDIRTLVPEAELRQRLDDPYEQQQMQAQVQVEGSRPETYLPIGIASLPWAVMNPTQAWRIFLPVPASQTK
jgi:hypothetical protein